MPLYASDTGGAEFEKCPTGNVQAVCVLVQDVGEEEYQGKWNRKCIISFELNHRIKDGQDAGKRHMLSNTYTISLSPKSNLRADLESWRGRGFTPEEAKQFDLEKLIGKNCLANVVEFTRQDGKQSVRIGSISPLMHGMQPLIPECQAVPEWIEKRRAANTAAAGKAANHHAATVREAPRDEWTQGQLPPANMGRPPERLATQGNVPLSQPITRHIDSPPPGPGGGDSSEPPFHRSDLERLP